MTSVLRGIFDAVAAFGQLVAYGVMTAVNLIIAGVGAVAGALISLLPSMPDTPDAPVAPWVGWLNWIIPVADLVAALLIFVGLWAAFLLVRIPLKWIKAL